MPDDGAVAQEDREAWQAVGKSADRAGEFEGGAHEGRVARICDHCDRQAVGRV